MLVSAALWLLSLLCILPCIRIRVRPGPGADDGARCANRGYGSNGQLGNGRSENIIGDEPGEMGDNLAAVQLGTGRTAKAISAGSYHTCAILDNDQAKCW